MPSPVFRLCIGNTSHERSRWYSTVIDPHGSTKRGRKAEDEAATLQQIRAVNPEAGVRFLRDEHLVLQKRRAVGPLVVTAIPFVLAFVTDDTISKLWRAKCKC